MDPAGLGVILDSSVAIDAEREQLNVTDFLKRIAGNVGEREASLCVITVAELAHGIYRADTPERREQRRLFLDELKAAVPVYPITEATAELVGRIGAESAAQHLTPAHLQDVKVRLGFVNSVGEQKGVDSPIVTDMIALARNRAISDAVLVSGDEDLRVGVQQAQEFGVRVHLIGIKPSRGSQSLFLLQEADTLMSGRRMKSRRFSSANQIPLLKRRGPSFRLAFVPPKWQIN
jgi:uncharacterized LabA/DUF88 family protein